ncbi:hypothetical protein [Chromobacterium phragmitis]|uniref:Antirepressor protein C-terminal domain-containing protein n=1 Tax=Chromobacterium phragmitis TaxID=2202141 RepID=A0ABV0IXA4_9NEIS
MSHENVFDIVRELKELRSLGESVAAKANMLLNVVGHPVDRILAREQEHELQVPEAESRREAELMLEYLLEQVASKTYAGSYLLENGPDKRLLVKLSDLVELYVAHSGRRIVNTRFLKQWLFRRGLLSLARNGQPLEVEKTLGGRRCGHMVGIVLSRIKASA